MSEKVLQTQYLYASILLKCEGDKMMSFSYKPLWKLLIDKDMTKKALMDNTHISKSTMDKMGRGEMVSLEVIDRICDFFHCDIAQVIEHYDRNEDEAIEKRKGK